MELIPTHLSAKSPKIKFVPQPLHKIALEICAKYGITLPLLRGNRRLGPLVAARNEFYYRAAMETEKSRPEIGIFIKRDQSTVSYGLIRYALSHNLPVPRGYAWQWAAAKSHGRAYPLDLENCNEGAFYEVKQALKGF